MASANSRSFVAVDWGTSSFRLWYLSGAGEVLQQLSGPFGMSTLERSDFSRVFEEQLTTLNIGANVPAVICGMAGAAQGWHEAAYVPTSEPLSRVAHRALQVPDIKRRIHILPGVMQKEPADVMRGEETQLLGLLQAWPDFEGTVCLPGTHSKWVRVRKGRIDGFTTSMTGELFALLCDQSILRHAVGEGGWDPQAFDAGVKAGIAAPERIAERLFGLRAESLLSETSADAVRSRLSGLLVGLELAATRPYREEGDGSTKLIGQSGLVDRYSRALELASASSDVLDAEDLTRRGLIAAFTLIEELSNGT